MSDPNDPSHYMDVFHHDRDYIRLKNVSYFAFFSERHQSDHVAVITVETIVLSLVFLVSVAANVGAVALVVRTRKQLANKTVLALNLFVADLLFVSMIPLIAAVRWTVSWRLGPAACHAVLYVFCVSGCVTITTLASISVERVQAVVRLQAAPALNLRTLAAALAFIWGFSALATLPLTLFFTVMEVDFPGQESVHICTLKWPDFTAEIVWDIAFTALCFLIPGLVIVLSYCKILQINRRSKRRLRAGPLCLGEPRHNPVSRQDIKLFRTLFVLMLSFLVMWSPIFIIAFLILARNFPGNLYVSSTMFFWIVTFTLANSALNPILYSICQFRNGWCRLCCGSAVTPVRRVEHRAEPPQVHDVHH